MIIPHTTAVISTITCARSITSREASAAYSRTFVSSPSRYSRMTSIADLPPVSTNVIDSCTILSSRAFGFTIEGNRTRARIPPRGRPASSSGREKVSSSSIPGWMEGMAIETTRVWVGTGACTGRGTPGRGAWISGVSVTWIRTGFFGMTSSANFPSGIPSESAASNRAARRPSISSCPEMVTSPSHPEPGSMTVSTWSLRITGSPPAIRMRERTVTAPTLPESGL